MVEESIGDIMKSVFIGIFVLALLATGVFAAGAGTDGPSGDSADAGDGSAETGAADISKTDAGTASSGEKIVGAAPTSLEQQNRGDDTQLRAEQQNGQQAGSAAGQGAMVREEVRTRVELRKQELDQELVGKSETQQQVLKNQNEVRLAVHALLGMKEELGGIGQQVSEVATAMDNSVKETVASEEKMQDRSAFSRFFAGGDKKAAEDIEANVVKNQERISEMQRLRESCEDCSDEAKQVLQEQIQTMEREQTRLKTLAESEKRKKGLFGWMWK